MNIHKHARLMPRGRALLVQRIEQGLRVEEAALAAGVSVRTACKWHRRFREEGAAGLSDRSSRPRHCPHATSPPLPERIVEQRRARRTYRQIALSLGLAISAVARRLRRLGLHRLAELEPAPPVVRYEYEHPGDLLHLDIKKLGRFRRPGHRVTGDRQQDSRGAGWEFVPVVIDDASRIAFTSLHPDERGSSACQALLQALRYYRSLGIRFQRIMTDNGACYRSKRFRRLSAGWVCAISGHDLRPRVPTARPSASSRPACASGPMRKATRIPSSARSTCRSGCTSTTGTAPMPASAIGHPSAALRFH